MTRIKTDVVLEKRIAALEAAPLRWWAGEAIFYMGNRLLELPYTSYSGGAVEKAIAHLRLRNETFGNPLTEARMAEIDANIHVEPLPVDYRNITPVSPYSG